MKKTIWTGTLTALVGAATIVALAQTPGQQSSSSSSSGSAATSQRITVIGCLREAPPAATDSGAAAGTAGTSGTAGAAASSQNDNEKYVLENATMTPAAADQGAAGSAASASGSTTGSASGAATGSASGATGTTGSGSGSATGTSGSAAGSTVPPSAQSNASEAAAAQSAQSYRLLANPTALTPHVGKKLELTGTLVPDQGAASASANAGSIASRMPLLRVEGGKVLAASCQQ